MKLCAHFKRNQRLDPDLGRFTQADTLLDGLNRYAYVRNNPVKYIDPTGHTHGETYWNAYDDYYSDPDNKNSDHPESPDEEDEDKAKRDWDRNHNVPDVPPIVVSSDGSNLNFFGQIEGEIVFDNLGFAGSLGANIDIDGIENSGLFCSGTTDVGGGAVSLGLGFGYIKGLLGKSTVIDIPSPVKIISIEAFIPKGKIKPAGYSVSLVLGSGYSVSSAETKKIVNISDTANGMARLLDVFVGRLYSIFSILPY